MPKAARKAKLPTMSLDEFLEWDDGTDTPYELYDGRPVAMNPPRPRHAGLVASLVVAIQTKLPTPCRIYANGGVIKPSDDRNYRTPDLVVACKISDQPWVEAPSLIVEVLSPSTKKVDAGEKLAFYGDIETVEEIVLVWSNSRRVDLWQREPGSWTVRSFIGSSALPLRVTTGPVPLDEIFTPFEL